MWQLRCLSMFPYRPSVFNGNVHVIFIKILLIRQHRNTLKELACVCTLFSMPSSDKTLILGL